eukprot:7051689-Ditylum_brightwellii.AAC.1
MAVNDVDGLAHQHGAQQRTGPEQSGHAVLVVKRQPRDVVDLPQPDVRGRALVHARASGAPTFKPLCMYRTPVRS